MDQHELSRVDGTVLRGHIGVRALENIRRATCRIEKLYRGYTTLVGSDEAHARLSIGINSNINLQIEDSINNLDSFSSSYSLVITFMRSYH